MSFINPLFLIGLAAAALPVLYHLVRRMRAKQVPFSSLMFLKATPKERIRRRRLRDRLLMAVRCAIFGLLALAFARPFLPPESLPFIAERTDQSVVLLVDNSFSMQVGGRFEAARSEVLRRLEAAGPRDEFAVVAFSDAAQPLSALSDDPTLLQAAARRLAPGYRTTDFFRALQMAEELLQDARHAQRQVVLISDFQQAGWGGPFEEWKLTPGVEFVPVSVAEGAVDNGYVSAFELSQKRVGEQVALRFDARVAPETNDSRSARLIIDGGLLDEKPPSAQRLTFQQVAPRAGVFQGDVSMAEDALPADDRHYFTYTVQDRPALLAVDENGRGAFFLRAALDLGDAARYAFSAGGRNRLSPAILRQHGVVFLVDPSPLSEREVQLLHAFVADGGSLIVSFGPNTQPAAASRLLQALGVGRAVALVDARAVQNAEAIVGEVDLRHPVFSAFGSSGSGAIFRPRFRRYLRVEPDSAAVVPARFDTGDPFLIEKALGTGKVLVYPSTFNTAWTDFPVNELYVPFLYQLVAHALSGTLQQQIFIVGESVLLNGRPGEIWDVRTPDDRVYQVQIDEDGRGFFREADVPGHYAAANGSRRFLFSVNVDFRESDLTQRDVEEAYAAVVPSSQDQALTPQQATTLTVEESEKEQKLWRLLVLLAVALFAFETAYANLRRN